MTPFKNRLPRRLAAAIGTVATLAAAVIPVGASVADNPVYPASLPTGYVSALPNSAWTISSDGRTASAPMPGNAPGEMTFSLGQVSADRFLGTRSDGSVTQPLLSPNGYAYPLSVNIAGINPVDHELIRPEYADCLVDDREVGPPKECFTHTATVTFSRPEIDPVIVIGSGSIDWLNSTDPSGSRGCYADSTEVTFADVDGATPESGRVELLDSMHLDQVTGVWSTAEATSVVENRLIPEPLVADRPNNCVLAHNPAVSVVKIEGQVSSITLAIHQMLQVTKTLTAPTTVVGLPNVTFGFSFPSADLSIEKAAPAAVDGLGTIDWALTVANAADSADSHGFVIHDAIPAEVTDPEIVSAPPGCTLSGHDLTCALAPDGYAVSQNPDSPTFADLSGGDPAVRVPSVLAAGGSIAIRLRGKAPLSSKDGIVNTATVSGVDIDPTTSSNTSTVTTRVTPSTWTMAKTATVDGAAPVGGVVQPGDIVTYTVTAESTHGPVPGIVMTDDLSAVLDHASFVPGSARLAVAGGESRTIADPVGVTLATPSFDLADGQRAVLTYQVRVGADAWSTSLRNTVTGTAEVPLTSCDPCTTDSQTGALVAVQKNGVDDDGAVAPIAGAAFEVLADDDGKPGAVLAGMPVSSVSGQTGRFEIRGLAPGTYWLTETKAPAGHVLLARPAAFSVSATGAVALVDPQADANLSASGGLITVGDGRTVALPFTGAAGPIGVSLLVGSGAVLLLLAAGTALLMRRRSAAV